MHSKTVTVEDLAERLHDVLAEQNIELTRNGSRLQGMDETAALLMLACELGFPDLDVVVCQPVRVAQKPRTESVELTPGLLELLHQASMKAG